MSYKRNQIEGALWAINRRSGVESMGGMIRHEKPPSQITVPTKRLLELDRTWAEEHEHQSNNARLAFFDEIPKGTGSDTSFSGEGVFCLALGLELLEFGFKQKEVVEKIASIRDQLNPVFKSVQELHRNPSHTEKGRFPLKEPPDPIFLILRRLEAADRTKASSSTKDQDDDWVLGHDICRGWAKLEEKVKETIPRRASSLFIVELSGLAARTSVFLGFLPATKRGRRATR